MTEPAETQRKEIFLALVSTQDNGISVADSRKQTAEQFELTAEQVIEIERAGIAAKWPPLDGSPATH